MKTLEDDRYWAQACTFFRGTGFAESPGSYFIHNKNAKTVKIGVRCQLVVSVGDEHLTCTADGRTTALARHSDKPIFKRVERLLRKDVPCFFVVSPDIHRSFTDRSLPQLLFVQPVLEFTFSPEQCSGQVSYAQDPESERHGRAMLVASREQPLPAEPAETAEPAPFAQLIAGWTPAEDDESFVKRLDEAIDILQDHPDGKLTLTRAYEHRLSATHSPFTLYERHARINGEYACSHFCCIRKDVFSLGTTPENVLETSGRKLTVDVVAATCQSTDDDEYLARELYENPKQVKEHRSSLANRQNRFRPYCEPGSVRVIEEMRIKTLRNVCHLHSVFVGELLPEVTIFDLMGGIFPLLGARPKELLAVADAEPAPHRYYGGVVGHTNAEIGGCFLNIRNALLNLDVIHAKVGVGVLKESDSHAELEETREKLSGLLEAIRLWEQSIPPAVGADPRVSDL